MSDSTIRPNLPPEIDAKIEALLHQSGEAMRAGKWEEEKKFAIEAWNTLPEPKLGWNFYSNIIPRDMVTAYRDHGEFGEALNWLATTRESYNSTPENPDSEIEFIAATLYYEMGDLDKAYDIFDWQFKNWKRRPFEGEDRKYLDFYLSRKGK